MLNLRHYFIFLSALAVTAPPLSGLYSLIILGAFCLVFFISIDADWRLRTLYALISFSAISLALSGFLSVELITVLYCCGFIIYFFPQYKVISLALLFIETPLFQQIIAIGSSFAPTPIGQAIPIICCITFLSLVVSKTWLKWLIFLIATLFLCFIGWFFNLEVLLVGLLNSLIFGLFLLSLKDATIKNASYKFYIVVFAVILHSSFIWHVAAKINPDNLVVWLPESTEKFEYQFFNDYVSSLNLAGIKAKRVTLASEIKPNSLVFMPWATEASAKQFIDEVKNAKDSNSFTILLGGEHTNYGKFADRLNPIFSNHVRFANTTTIPPGNKNSFGALWTSSILQFPIDAPLNRGSSIDILSLNAFPLLVAKSIFSDLGPIEANDFWVGDFLLGQSDPRGWLVLAAAYRDGPLWILTGDNSFLMNRYFLPNPKPIKHIISLASLYPTLHLQLIILLFSCLFVCIRLQIFKVTTRRRLIYLLSSLLAAISINSIAENKDYITNNSLSNNLKYFGGDERSSAAAISSNSKIIDTSMTKLFVHEKAFTSQAVGKSGKAEVHIGHIKNEFNFDGVIINNCGLTNFQTTQGEKLSFREAQFCKVNGDANIIVGNNDQAIVVEIKSTPPITLILDRYFISGSPPINANINYVLRLLSDPTSD
jgi:hypothetical protein